VGVTVGAVVDVTVGVSVGMIETMWFLAVKGKKPGNGVGVPAMA